ncbi:Eukaryotic peptide chain release factor GTP-binding subunit [Marasmius crinis-equi]|uniref:Eukaryotic peptide chain release factor GTP-binding subunit n=1 Tax=Marasmius crinis-equi TaxID=585013 RepID=A0ABR3FGB4_9AGAR
MPPTTTTATSTTHAGGIQPSASFFRPSRPNNQGQHSPIRDVFALEDISHRESDVSEPTDSSKVFNLRRGMSMDVGGDSTTQEYDDDDPTSTHGKVQEEEAMSIGRYKPSSPSPSQSNNGHIISQRRDRRRSSNTDISSSFIPSSFPHTASLAESPRINPKTNKPFRNHEFHPSRNRFFLDGKLLTGGDNPWAFIFSFSIILIIGGLWFGATCPWYWSNLGGGGKAIVILGAYLAAIVYTSMLTAATMDPGILPRNLDPDPPYPSTSPSDGGVRAPMPRDLKGTREILSDL